MAVSIAASVCIPDGNVKMDCDYGTIYLSYHMTVGVSHDCPHLIGTDRILSLMPQNSPYFCQTYRFFIRMSTRLTVPVLSTFKISSMIVYYILATPISEVLSVCFFMYPVVIIEHVMGTILSEERPEIFL